MTFTKSYLGKFHCYFTILFDRCFEQLCWIIIYVIWSTCVLQLGTCLDVNSYGIIATTAVCAMLMFVYVVTMSN